MDSEAIATLSYKVPHKTVGWIEQTVTTAICTLSLHENKIVSQHSSYPIHAVHDCSYRPFSDGTCLFYLHTNQGVRSFHVNVDPTFFLKSFRRLRGDLYL
ncbi:MULTISPECIES: hypothetical protein [unclassified Sporosarcina]|uniref:hypothetical protein n=1 Tax=unclassified Sporosarcina TaxID=2647733 RepID=UPI00057AE0F5|nr:hypothetical protein [Sporosarcina sp. ZBG7A]VDG97179.1 Uncharacterised protein [Lysinibacillus sphaericus]